MLSEQTKRNFEDAFRRAAAASLVRSSGDVCDIERVPMREFTDKPGKKLLLVTISSFVFRLSTIFQVSQNDATRAYYCGTADLSVDEAFAEFANMCCGALNRELASEFPHLAMSIPYALNRRCFAFLDELKPQFHSTFNITINNSIKLQATLCMCCLTPIEFVPTAVEVNHDGGELELF